MVLSKCFHLKLYAAAINNSAFKFEKDPNNYYQLGFRNVLWERIKMGYHWSEFLRSEVRMILRLIIHFNKRPAMKYIPLKVRAKFENMNAFGRYNSFSFISWFFLWNIYMASKLNQLHSYFDH